MAALPGMRTEEKIAMGFGFKRDEGIAEGLRRIAAGQIGSALEEISSERLKPDKKVHQVRKRCKKLRGLVRLARPGMPEAYRKENAWIRDTAGPLGELRDSQTVLTTLEGLLERYSDQIQPAAFDPLRRSLARNKQDVAGDRGAVDRALAQAGERLAEMKDRLPRWEFEPDKVATLVEGLTDYYGRGREALQLARKDTTPDTLHEWRKRVKDHWYHCDLMEGVWPAMVRPLSGVAHELSEYLGDDHDLAVLLDLARGDAAAFGSAEDLQAFTGLVNQRRAMLQRKAFAAGRRLYAEQPDRFADRWGKYCRVWKRERR